MNNEIKNLEKLLDFDLNNKNFIIDNIIEHHFKINNNNSVDISNEIFKDTNILNWGENIPTLQGSKKLFTNILKNPINDKNLLLSRQKSYFDDYDDIIHLKY